MTVAFIIPRNQDHGARQISSPRYGLPVMAEQSTHSRSNHNMAQPSRPLLDLATSGFDTEVLLDIVVSSVQELELSQNELQACEDGYLEMVQVVRNEGVGEGVRERLGMLEERVRRVREEMGWVGRARRSMEGDVSFFFRLGGVE